MVFAPNLSQLDWLTHGFGQRDSVYPEAVTTLRQIHSCVVMEVKGEGGDRIADGDGIVSDRPGLVVGVRTADCVPVLLADRASLAVAAIHAGWRGTAASIVPATLAQMFERYKTLPCDVVAAIGPSIGGCCYEVSPDVARQFGTWVPELRHTDSPQCVDLKTINLLQLRDAGIKDVWVSEECTFCSPAYHSYRRDKDDAGRMISFIGRNK